MRDDRIYLEDIQEAIERIEKYAERGRDTFDSDELVQIWVIHHLQIIGEAVGKLTGDLKEAHPEVPWATIKAMRNVLVHFYFGVNLDKVWGVVEDELPMLKSQVLSVLSSLPPDPDESDDRSN